MMHKDNHRYVILNKVKDLIYVDCANRDSSLCSE